MSVSSFFYFILAIELQECLLCSNIGDSHLFITSIKWSSTQPTLSASYQYSTLLHLGQIVTGLI